MQKRTRTINVPATEGEQKVWDDIFARLVARGHHAADAAGIAGGALTSRRIFCPSTAPAEGQGRHTFELSDED
jgi:hypothetical protein